MKKIRIIIDVVMYLLFIILMGHHITGNNIHEILGTGISGCEKDLRNAYPEYSWKEGKRLTGNEDKSFIENWINV